MMDKDKAIRAAKLTAGAVFEKNRAKTAVSRAGGQIAPSKYLPNVPRAVHADGGKVLPKGYSLKVDKNKLGVLAHYNGQPVGQLTLMRDRDSGDLTAFQMAVHPKHQRKGLMSAMHDAAEEAFGPMQPDKTLTDDGFAFWKGYRPDAVSNNLRFHADKLMGQTMQTRYGPGTVKSVGSNGMNTDLTDPEHAGSTGWASAKDNEDAIRGLGIDTSTLKYASGGAVTDTDDFRNWFGNSVTHTNGDPHVFYTGTSKDKDFTSHNVGRHGAWFTRDPAEASMYAESNDSMGYYPFNDPPNRKSRVIPAYVKAENPYTGELADEAIGDNYKRLQSNWFDTLRANGHDSWVPASQNGNLVVALKEPQQIKSIFNSGKFDPNQKHMNKAEGGEIEGGTPMDNNNVTDLSTVRTMRDINSGNHSDNAQSVMSELNNKYSESQKAFDMAHASGAFDNFQMGDTYKYKGPLNYDPDKIVGFTMKHVSSAPNMTKLFNNHYPAIDLEKQNSDRNVKTVPLEWFEENLHKYDKVGGRPRIVKAGGGETEQQNGEPNVGTEAAPNDIATRPQAGGLPIAGGLRGGSGVLQTQNEAPLEGLPTKVGIPFSGGSITAGPDPRIRQVARDYMAQSGLPYNPPTKYAKVDPKRAARIASSYEDMKDDHSDPLTKASYDAMIKETMAQYKAAKDAGFKAEFWHPDKQEDPYKASPRLATEDVRDNHHMWVYPTYAGYGSGDPISEDDAKKNPLLQLTGETWNGIPVTVNDVFRAVHDYYGHAKEGVGFRGDGEENAWRAHASMFSPLARMAMTSETRGQNSWLNYGPHGEKNRTARTEDTIFAPQKIGIMDHLAHHDGAEDFMNPDEIKEMAAIRKRYGRNTGGAVDSALSLTRRFTKNGIGATMTLKPRGK